MTPPPKRDSKSGTGASRRDRVIFLALLVFVALLGVLLLIRVRPGLRQPARPGPPPEPVEVAQAPRWTPPVAAPESQPESQPASGPFVVPDPPPGIPVPPPPESNVQMIYKDGKWVPFVGLGNRSWSGFRSTPPNYFISEEEEKRFREYWMKEAAIRTTIYCQLTDVCPPPRDVDRLLGSLFDDILPQREQETVEQYSARRDRWFESRKEWQRLFGDTPQSIFSFAGLEQHRGPDVPKPPLESGEPPASQPAPRKK